MIEEKIKERIKVITNLFVLLKERILLKTSFAEEVVLRFQIIDLKHEFNLLHEKLKKFKI